MVVIVPLLSAPAAQLLLMLRAYALVNAPKSPSVAMTDD